MSGEDQFELLPSASSDDSDSATTSSVSNVERGGLSASIAVAGIAAVAAVLIWLVVTESDTAGPSQTAPVTTSVGGTVADLARVETSVVQSTESSSIATESSEVGDSAVLWPQPPVDHRPQVLGRPGQPIIDDDERHRSVVYVNVRGRPTVIDLASGSQQEVLVADTRTQDKFAIEFGQVVSTTSTRKNLPRSRGREIVFTAHRSAQLPEGFPGEADPGLVAEPVQSPDLDFLMGPSLCLDAAGCDPIRWEEGSYGNSTDLARSVETNSEALELLGQIFGSSQWVEGDGPFTLFTIGNSEAQRQVRIPTPQREAIVWLVEHQTQ